MNDSSSVNDSSSGPLYRFGRVDLKYDNNAQMTENVDVVLVSIYIY